MSSIFVRLTKVFYYNNAVQYNLYRYIICYLKPRAGPLLNETKCCLAGLQKRVDLPNTQNSHF